MEKAYENLDKRILKNIPKNGISPLQLGKKVTKAYDDTKKIENEFYARLNKMKKSGKLEIKKEDRGYTVYKK